MSDTRLHNSQLKNETTGTGSVIVIDLGVDDLINIGMMESETIPSPELMRVVDAISDQLGISWKSEPLFWDPLDRGLGGAVFITNIWREIV